MKVIIQYSIADLRHVQNNKAGVLTNWYRANPRYSSCFLRNSGYYYGSVFSNSGCYYHANKAIKINGWYRFVKEQAVRGVHPSLDERTLYLNRQYATAIYEICFTVFLPPKIDILYMLDQFFKLPVRVSKSFREQGNNYLAKDFKEKEYLTLLGKAEKQITNHYISATTKKEVLEEQGNSIYKYVKCFSPRFLVLLGKDEYINFRSQEIKAVPRNKEHIILIDRNDKKGIKYQGHIFVNTNWEKTLKNTYSNFIEALSVKDTLDEVLHRISTADINPLPRSEEADALQGFLKNCIDHFKKEENFITDTRLREILYVNPKVLNRSFNFDYLKTQVKEVINIRPNLFRIIDSYLNENKTMTVNIEQVNVNHTKGAVVVGEVNDAVIGNVNGGVMMPESIRRFEHEAENLLKELQENKDARLEEIKKEVEGMKTAVRSNDKNKAKERLEKLKTYGGLVLDFAKTVASFIPFFD